MSPTQAVILCGGRGTRLRPYTDSMPKPMVPCNGRPFLEYLVEQLATSGVERILLLTGYRHDHIESYFGDGSRFGVQVSYSQGPTEWDTGTRLWEARSTLDARFLLLYSDNIVPFPLDIVLAQHVDGNWALTLLLSRKTPGNISVSSDGRVAKYDSSRSDSACDHVEIGYMVAERDRLLSCFAEPVGSLSSVLAEVAAGGQLGGWVQDDAYHSISDPDRWRLTERYLEPKKIILLDRDGVLNHKSPRGTYVRDWSEFRWIPAARAALRQLATEGYRFIVITNQAGIAREIVERYSVDEIHSRMTETLSEEDGVEILGVYVCPHHWDEGCSCRKPKPGMLHQAARDHLLRLDRTLYIGDDPRDREAAHAAGCPCLLVNPDGGIDCDVLPEALQEVRLAFESAFRQPGGCELPA
jgi:histidinol-phosphate phosphatase family protein